MVETVGEVLQRPCLGYFSTVHVDGQVEGEIEPDFYEEFKTELGRYWRLFDSAGLQLMVEFNNDDDVPRITNGWMTLRAHYKFEGHHAIFFKYLGTNNLGTNYFQIIPDMNKIYSPTFPTWHTDSRGLRKSVNYTLTMSEDPEVVPYLTLPEAMGEYLWGTMLDQLYLVGTNFDEKTKCELRYQYDPFVVRIERGWSEFARKSGFKAGDRLRMNMCGIHENYLIWVTKLS
ncbi:DNA helicase [Trifolium repens]|nr:DNA helicase [Trifolium repens]